MRKVLFVAMASILFMYGVFSLSKLPIFASAEQMPDTDILMVVADESEAQALANTQQDHLEVITKDQLSLKDNNHIAYAVSRDLFDLPLVSQILNEAYSKLNARIYIYGGLSIRDYKQLLNMDELYISVNICNNQDIVTSSIKMGFVDEDKINQITCLSRSENYQSLIVSGNEMQGFDAQNFIVRHYNRTYVNPFAREATIIQSSFNHVVWANTYFYINVDYMLYKDDAESDISHDYFALRTNVTGCTDNGYDTCREIQVKHQLIHSSDNVTDYVPKDTSSATNVNVSLSYGPSASASIGFSFGSGAGPTIDSTYTPNEKLVEWKVSKYWFFGSNFTGDMFSFGSSWATRVSPVRVSVSTYGCFDLPHNYQTNTGWDTQEVVFYY